MTERSAYRARAVLLSIGRRGTPRKLGVAGEDLPKVVYRLIDPEQYRGQAVLVVGGGDSALEAALSIADEADTTVTLSYRGEAFSRAKQKNRERLRAAQVSGQLRVYFNSTVTAISAADVDLDVGDKPVTLPNDAIIVCAGGILPTAFLKDSGVGVETKYGTR
jgi:thioredoxin reductase